MKFHSIVLAAASALIMTSHGQSVERPPMRKAPTNEELIRQLRESEQVKVAKPSVPSSTVDPGATQQPQDLISRSEILCYNGSLTLIPKRAVLQIPKNLEDRLKAQPGAHIRTWSDFY